MIGDLICKLLFCSSLTDTTKVIQFCGHRLHIHPKFRLYLTMTTPITSLPPSLSSDLTVINLGSSVPLAQDILLDEAFQVLLPEESADFVAVCAEVAELKKRLCQLESEVFRSLPKGGKMQNYWQATNEIKETVNLKNEVCVNYMC